MEYLQAWHLTTKFFPARFSRREFGFKMAPDHSIEGGLGTQYVVLIERGNEVVASLPDFVKAQGWTPACLARKPPGKETMTKTKTKSDRHKEPRRKLGQSTAEFKRQDKVASKEGTSWADWARAALKAARISAESADKE